MILHALNDYYNRLKEDENSDIPLLGFSRQKIHFALIIDKSGNLLQPLDIRISEKKKKFPRPLVVPDAVKRTVGIASNFLWDNTGYVLGADNKGKPERTLKTYEAFKAFQHLIGDNVDDEGMKAVLLFLDSWNPENAPTLPYWEEMAGQNVVFQLDTDDKLRYIHDRPAIQQAWLKYSAENASEIVAKCLVSGIDSPIARIHPALKGVRNAQSSGAAMIAFNNQAFESYAKTQNYNAPVSETIAFTYTTALNHLLNADSRQKIQIGDATTIFWTETKSKIEQFGMSLFGFEVEKDGDEDNKESDDKGVLKDVRDFLEAARDGKELPNIERDAGFFILGLSPNAARVSVRFWHQSTVGDFQEKIGQHFRDLYIDRYFEDQPEFPSPRQLLRETAVLRKMENISPLLSGALIRSIMTGAAYPKSLLSAVINRIHADHSINYLRVSMIKAYLTRMFRIREEVGMALDKETADRLGRLFAVLEKAQEDAHKPKKLNRTIKDSYYSSASTVPRAVFPQLLKLAQHHIQSIRKEKIEYGYAVEKRIGTILQDVKEFPAHLSLEEQGLFALGYYHQRYPKKSEESGSKEEVSNE